MRETLKRQCLNPEPHGYHGWSEIDDVEFEERFYVCIGVPNRFTRRYTELNPPIQFQEPSNGEVRTTSATGGQKGVKPERYSLIPVEALDIMAKLYGFGAQKYAAHNWRKGYEWSKSFDSLFRHATAALRGEDIDPETGLPHLAGAAFHCFTLMVFMEEQREFDDRFKPEKDSD